MFNQNDYVSLLKNLLKKSDLKILVDNTSWYNRRPTAYFKIMVDNEFIEFVKNNELILKDFSFYSNENLEHSVEYYISKDHLNQYQSKEIYMQVGINYVLSNIFFINNLSDISNILIKEVEDAKAHYSNNINIHFSITNFIKNFESKKSIFYIKEYNEFISHENFSLEKYKEFSKTIKKTADLISKFEKYLR